MALFQFSVYPTEHVYLHHKYVGTVKDPITSPKGQDFYTYTLKAFVSAHKFVWSYSPKVFAACMAANWGYLGLLLWFGKQWDGEWSLAFERMGFFLGVGMACFGFLELVEYIEHYGLVFL